MLTIAQLLTQFPQEHHRLYKAYYTQQKTKKQKHSQLDLEFVDFLFLYNCLVFLNYLHTEIATHESFMNPIERFL